MLAPQLRDVTVNQGLGSYPRLARGKDTLVRFYLSLPVCAPQGSSIRLTGGSLTVSGAGATLATVRAPTPAPAPLYPPLVAYGSAPAANATGDPVFVVPGSTLAPAGNRSSFTASFSGTLRYEVRTSANANPTTGSVTLSQRPGSQGAISATVEAATNALRVLVVPMGDPTRPFGSQFSEAARAATVNGMSTVSRLFPLPSTVSELSGAGGLRYTINPALLDISPLLGGQSFCGTGANFNGFKGLLGQFLQSWNTANPDRSADRVLGVIDAGISAGSDQGCADGMAAVGETAAWVRAVPDVAGAPSPTGALMVMELAHTLGLVPENRDLFSSPFHSANTQADVTAPDRGYNLNTRSFLADDRTALTVSGNWNNDTVLLERDDYALLSCRLGGTTSGECPNPGTVGSSTGVGANPTFVLSGTTDGSPGGTAVVESYFRGGVPRTAAAPGSEYQLVQLGAEGDVLRADGVPVQTEGSEHDDATGTVDEEALGLFSVAFEFNTSAQRIELRRGATVLYARDRNGPPSLDSTTISPPGGGGGGGGGSGATERVSVDVGGGDQNNSSTGSRTPISSDGRYVAFSSIASDLVAGDGNGVGDVFLRDRVAGTTTRVSVDVAGGDPNGGSGSFEISLSDDGRYVAFESTATDLVPGDGNGVTDVFVRDVVAGTTTRVSVDSAGGDANGESFFSPMSADGRYVVFGSQASDLVAGDGNATSDVYRRDLLTGTTTRVSVDTFGGDPDRYSTPDSISADGRYVTMYSLASDLLPVDDLNGTGDVYLRDVTAGTTTRVSVDASGGDSNDISFRSSVSDDGRYVAFGSQASDLVAGDGNFAVDVFLRDLVTSTTTRVSVDEAGGDANGGSDRPSMSGDGRWVVFDSSASDLVAGDGNVFNDVFIRDVVGVSTERVSVDAGGADSDNDSYGSSVSDDGRYVSFQSSASDLVVGDGNGFSDVFVRDRAGGGTPAPPGQNQVAVGASDAIPENLRLDLFYSCGGVSYPVAVGLPPEATTATGADFTFNFDPALACDGGSVNAVLNDGFETATGPPTPVPDELGNREPTPAIATPTIASAVLQYGVIPLRGRGVDPEATERVALRWLLDGTSVGTGPVIDLSPPAGGWTPGTHTITLRATDPAGQTTSTSTEFNIVADANNDGVPGG